MFKNFVNPFQSTAVRLVLSLVRSSMKNRQTKKQFKAQMLDIFHAIRETYADDPDFQ